MILGTLSLKNRAFKMSGRHTDTKLCKSITVVLMVLFKKKKKRIKKKIGENQPIILCTELKIVINRACFKNKLTNKQTNKQKCLEGAGG